MYISVNTPSPSSITAKVNGKETDDQITINAGEKLENISFEVLPSTTLQDVDVTLEGIGELTKITITLTPIKAILLVKLQLLPQVDLIKPSVRHYQLM